MHVKEFTQTNHLHLQSHFSHQLCTQKVLKEEGLKVEKCSKPHRHHEWDHFVRCNLSKPSFYLHFGKVICHGTSDGLAVITESQAVC